MSYNIIHDDESGNKPQLWNNIKVNKLTCSELFLANGFDTQFYNGVGPALILRNGITDVDIPTLNPIETFFQRFGNVITLRINTYIVVAGSTTPAPLDLIPAYPFPNSILVSFFICPYSHVIGVAAQDTLTYKLSTSFNGGHMRMRNNGVGVNSEFFDNTLALEFYSTSITYMLSP